MKNTIWFAAFLLSLTLLSCGGGEHSPTDTGSASFGLTFEETSAPPSMKLAPSMAAATDICSSYGIDSISGTVYKSYSMGQWTAIATGGPWACSAHTGTIYNIPAGSNVRIAIQGSVGGTVVWQGETTGKTIYAGQDTNVGAIAMTYTGSDTTRPTVSAATPTGTTVALTSSITVTFSEAMASSTIDTTTFTLKNGSVALSGSVTYNATTKVATFTPTSSLSNSTAYTATVTTGVTDMAANKMLSLYTWSFTTEAPPGSAPSAPTGVSATAADKQVTISWIAVTGATSYNIYWSTTTGVTKTNGTKITGATSPYIHTALTNGTTYYYVVTAVNSYGESVASSQVSATPNLLLIQGGVINLDTTWNRTDVVYAITNNLLINQGVTLTVAPGVTVQFATGTYLKVKGTISAVGTSASKIVFQNANIVVDWTWSSEDSWPQTYSPSSGTYVTGPRFEYCDLTGGLISSTSQTFYGMGAYIRNSTVTNAWNDSGWTGIKGAYIGSSAVDSLAGGGGLLSSVITNSYIKTVNIDGYSSGYSPGTIFEHNAIDILTVDRWNIGLTVANNNIANVVLKRPSTSAQYSGGVVLNNNNFTTISGYTIEVVEISDSSVNVNAQLNYWGPTTTAEMNAKGPGKLIDKIYDMYADFNLVEVDHSNYFGSTIVGAGPDW